MAEVAPGSIGVPDRIPLALEYRDSAAYSLHPVPKAPNPSAWPSDQLTDSTLFDPKAMTTMPLVRLFDGIGLLVARSDWSANATYVTFKAGDNFWSHSHLDQGASRFMGGALAMDGGFYGPKYGSDHDMNYSYETIAPTPSPSPITKILFRPAKRNATANRQRRRSAAHRVGLGRRGRAARSENEWETKRDTTSMGPLLDQDGLAVT